MPLGSALMLEVVCRTELSTEPSGWALGALTGKRPGHRKGAPGKDSSKQQSRGQGVGGNCKPALGEGAFWKLTCCLSLEVSAGHGLLGSVLRFSPRDLWDLPFETVLS